MYSTVEDDEEKGRLTYGSEIVLQIFECSQRGDPSFVFDHRSSLAAGFQAFCLMIKLNSSAKNSKKAVRQPKNNIFKSDSF